MKDEEKIYVILESFAIASIPLLGYIFVETYLMS